MPPKTTTPALCEQSTINIKHGVGVIIFRHDGQVLLGHRHGAHGADTWGFPGGHLEPNETLTDCAIRETLEETGLTLSHLTNGPSSHDRFEDSATEYITHFVIARAPAQTPIIKEPNKCKQWRWFEWDKLNTEQLKLFKPVISLRNNHYDFKTMRSEFYQNSLSKTPYKLVSFDLDGTLVLNTSTTLFYAERLGVKKPVLQLERDFSNREINSEQFMQQIATIMSGLSLRFIKQHVDALPFINDIATTLWHLKKQGIRTMIVTTANQEFASAVAEKFGFDDAYGTTFEVQDNGNIGRGIKVCSTEHKILHVANMVKRHNISMSQVVAIGDSLTDTDIFTKVGRSIAINYDQHLIGKADRYVRSSSLLDVLNHFN
jgi:HAD superfamily phosphoserine phosphatase-like hydrolase